MEILNFFTEVFHSYDVKDQKVIEQQIKKMQKIDEILPSLESFYTIINAKSQGYEFVSKNFEITTMYTSEEMSEGGMPFWFSKIHPFDLPMFMEAIDVLLDYNIKNVDPEDRYNILYSWNFRHKKKNGEYVNLLEQLTPLYYDEDGTPILFLAHCTIIGSGKPESLIGALKLLKNDNEYVILHEENFSKNFELKLLSKREQEVFKLLVKGNTSKEMAEELKISSHTVDGHRRKIIEKLDFKNTSEMIQFFKENNSKIDRGLK
ncbi:LuxR C-terminal-related transcriptional regulator [Aureivirga sp. CE67]|uniref:LuxR C-terminal-related transcriptional regulator n=1 Tax=Aureivirga sp. CE67 TaxID=1788983 RepID=UPI0018C93664|nr:LuxR C-terminal-related transcriptional regulator [Aureivirga sp. CE67]